MLEGDGQFYVVLDAIGRGIHRLDAAGRVSKWRATGCSEAE
jgi:hypothetical protein